ncbi:MAG: PrpR N-terminal domain-containing protein [Enterocloster sp.]
MCRNIGVIGYNNLLSGLECLNPILNVSIRQIFAVDENDTCHQIQKLKNEGIDVIVGGLLQTHIMPGNWGCPQSALS